MRRYISSTSKCMFGALTVLALHALATSSVAVAEDLYVPTIHIINTQGKYEKMVIGATEDGVSRIECEMRADAWKAKFGSAIEAAMAQFAEEGQHPSIRVTCERK